MKRSESRKSGFDNKLLTIDFGIKGEQNKTMVIRQSDLDKEERTVMPKEDNLEGLSGKEQLQREKAKLKDMTWGQRIAYIWDYYKIVFVIIIAVIALGSLAATIIHNMGMEQVLQTVFFNCASGADTEGLEQGFVGYLGGLEKKQELMFDYSLYYDLNAEDTYSMAASTKVIAYNMTGDLDCMVMPEDLYHYYVDNGMFASLEDLLTPEELKQWEGDIDRGKQPEDTGEHPYGIRITDSQALKDSGLYPGTEEIYLGIPMNAGNMENAVAFLRFLMGDI